jgi:FkbM family methyltransferase
MPDLWWHLKARRHRAAEFAGALIDRQARERRRREQFWKLAGRYASAITVPDRFGNFSITLNTADPGISRLTFVWGVFAPGATDHFIAALAGHGYEPEQIVDVGANIGTSTWELLSAYPRASAVCIEPHPDNYRLLRQNVTANDLDDRVRTVNAAVGDVDSIVELTVNPHNPGDHQIGGKVGEHTVTVPMRRLADIVRVDRPTAVTIDVQGYEGHVLRGAGAVLGCPALVEFWPSRLKETGGYAWFLEAARCYETVFEVARELHVVGDLEQLGARLESTDGFADLLLLPWPVSGPQ